MWLEKYVKEVGIATDYPKFNGEECIYINLRATDLFLAQYYNGEFNAIDVVVKLLAVENYYKIIHNSSYISTQVILSHFIYFFVK